MLYVSSLRMKSASFGKSSLGNATHLHTSHKTLAFPHSGLSLSSKGNKLCMKRRNGRRIVPSKKEEMVSHHMYIENQNNQGLLRHQSVGGGVE